MGRPIPLPPSRRGKGVQKQQVMRGGCAPRAPGGGVRGRGTPEGNRSLGARSGTLEWAERPRAPSGGVRGRGTPEGNRSLGARSGALEWAERLALPPGACAVGARRRGTVPSERGAAASNGRNALALPVEACAVGARRRGTVPSERGAAASNGRNALALPAEASSGRASERAQSGPTLRRGIRTRARRARSAGAWGRSPHDLLLTPLSHEAGEGPGVRAPLPAASVLGRHATQGAPRYLSIGTSMSEPYSLHEPS